MSSPLVLRVGSAQDVTKWSALYWVYDGDIPASADVAIRQQRSDGQWYITVGTIGAARAVAGPLESLDAAHMMLLMHTIDF